jgi:hypothetical protein
MIAEIPTTQPDAGNSDLIAVCVAILPALITLWIGYRLGLRSQREAEKLKAKNCVLSVIDNIFADIPKYAPELTDLFTGTMETLKVNTIGLSCQLSERKRLKIEKALKDYQALDISWRGSVVSTYVNEQKIKEEEKAFPEALNKLRGEVKKA